MAIHSWAVEQLMHLQLNTTDGIVNLFNIYALTLTSSVEVRHNFNEYLMSTSPLELDQIRKHCPCLGHLGVKKTNENGHHFLELYTFHKLYFTNTHCVTGLHHRSKHWHQLDLIMTRREHLKGACISRVYHSAGCNTDHSLVLTKVKLQQKNGHRSTPYYYQRMLSASKCDFPLRPQIS